MLVERVPIIGLCIAVLGVVVLAALVVCDLPPYIGLKLILVGAAVFLAGFAICICRDFWYE